MEQPTTLLGRPHNTGPCRLALADGPCPPDPGPQKGNRAGPAACDPAAKEDAQDQPSRRRRRLSGAAGRRGRRQSQHAGAGPQATAAAGPGAGAADWKRNAGRQNGRLWPNVGIPGERFAACLPLAVCLDAERLRATAALGHLSWMVEVVCLRLHLVGCVIWWHVLTERIAGD